MTAFSALLAQSFARGDRTAGAFRALLGSHRLNRPFPPILPPLRRHRIYSGNRLLVPEAILQDFHFENMADCFADFGVGLFHRGDHRQFAIDTPTAYRENPPVDISRTTPDHD